MRQLYSVLPLAVEVRDWLYQLQDAAETDPEIARDVVRELDSHVSIPADRIKVTVKDSWVTLEGTVDWEYQKKLAISAVKKLKGVCGVTDKITVKPSVSPKRSIEIMLCFRRFLICRPFRAAVLLCLSHG